MILQLRKSCEGLEENWNFSKKYIQNRIVQFGVAYFKERKQMLLWSSTVKYCKYIVAPSSDLTKNFTSVPNILTTLFRTSFWLNELKDIAQTMEQILTYAKEPNAIFWYRYIYIYIYIETHMDRWPHPLNMCWWMGTCILHRKAPQIISRPVRSVTAVVQHIQIHKSNPHLLFKNQIICVSFSEYDVSNCPL